MTISGGNPVVQGAGTLASPFKANYYTFANASSFNTSIGPSDGLQHYITSASVQVYAVAGTVSGLCIASSQLLDTGGSPTDLLITAVYFNGFATTGTFPGNQLSMSWPGGVTIQQRANGVSQVQWIGNINGLAGGSITSPRIEAYATLTWI